MKGQENNFTFVRIVACLMVIVSHLPVLLGRSWQVTPFGLIGVIIFFSVSGYLVTLSWDSDPDPARFLTRRALRIFPGLIVSVLFCAFVIGPIFSALPLKQYLSNPTLTQFIGNIFLFPIAYQLPGLFGTNPYPSVVNGPLWTLPMEATMYLSLSALGALRLWRTPQIFVLLVASAAVAWYLVSSAHLHVAPQFLTMDREQLALSAFAFCFGGLMARLPRGALVWWAFIPVAAILPFRWQHAELILLITALVPYATLGIAIRSTAVLRYAGRFGDPSYGVYIYAFPIQQVVMHLWPHISAPSFVAASVAVPLVAGFSSWHLIERIALRWKPKRMPNESRTSSAASTPSSSI
jgi:peptidoglycan/LPS O-acetylase OafA/YrhL